MDAVLSPSPVAPSAALLSLVLDRAAAAVADAADVSRVETVAGEAVADRIDTDAVAEAAAARIAASIDASDIAAEIDLADLAGNIDVSDVAGNIDVSDVADNIDLAALAEEMEDRRESDILDRLDDLSGRIAALEEREPAAREDAAEAATVREPVQFGPPAPVASEALLAAVRDATVAALIAALNAAAAEGRL